MGGAFGPVISDLSHVDCDASCAKPILIQLKDQRRAGERTGDTGQIKLDQHALGGDKAIKIAKSEHQLLSIKAAAGFIDINKGILAGGKIALGINH